MKVKAKRISGRAGWAAALVAAGLALAPVAHAGRACEGQPPSVRSVEQGLALAQRTAQALDASGARLVVLARAGQDLRRYGQHYSHLGLAYRNEQGHWRVLHKLNACGTAVAALYRQGLAEFFLDDLWRHEAAWAVPQPEVQARLLVLLTDPARATALHAAPYSMVSYAWGRRYQQSNQWVLETLAAAMEPSIRTREQAQAWLQFKDYQPAVLTLGPLTRLGARVGSAHIAFDDHPGEKRFADRIETVSADSVFAWLPRAGLAAAPVALRLQ